MATGQVLCSIGHIWIFSQLEVQGWP
jgi:hypothetical protein